MTVTTSTVDTTSDCCFVTSDTISENWNRLDVGIELAGSVSAPKVVCEIGKFGALFYRKYKNVEKKDLIIH